MSPPKWDNGTGFVCRCIYETVCAFIHVCVHLPHGCTRVTLCNVLMLECASALKAISSPVSILYALYPQPSEIEGLFFFVMELVQQLSDLTSQHHFYSSQPLCSKHPHTTKD